MRDPIERLRDMLETIENIERYATQGKETFEKDELLQSWIVRHLQIIGEAARVMPQDLIDRTPHIPWSKIIGMRIFSSMIIFVLIQRLFGRLSSAICRI